MESHTATKMCSVSLAQPTVVVGWVMLRSRKNMDAVFITEGGRCRSRGTQGYKDTAFAASILADFIAGKSHSDCVIRRDGMLKVECPEWEQQLPTLEPSAHLEMCVRGTGRHVGCRLS